MQILVIILFCLPVIWAYFTPGYPFTHDGASVVIRLADMIRNLREGQFPVRYSGFLNFGYGYPLFNFAYPFPYYLGAALKFILRFSLTDIIKVIFAASVPLSAIFMFLAARKLWKNNWAALISSIFYIYLPFRIVNLYIRGSIGESLGTVFYPLIIWLALEMDGQKKTWLVGILALAVGTLITTHNITAVYALITFVPLILTFLATKKWWQAGKFLLAIILGFGLSSFFWLPAILEKSYVLLSKTPIADRSLFYLNPMDLWAPKWGFNSPNFPDGFGYQLGWPHLAIFIFVVIWLTKTKHVFTFFAVLTVLGLGIMLFPFSDFIWKIMPVLKEINYPWTLLLPIGFLISLLAGSLKKLAFFVLPFTIFLLWGHLNPISFLVHDDDWYYLTNDATTTSSMEFTPIWVEKTPGNRPLKKLEFSESKDLINKSVYFEGVTAASQAGIAQLNTQYFPGWRVFIDKAEVSIDYQNPAGVMRFNVPPGDHLVAAKFSDTLTRQLANLISLFTLGIIFLSYISMGINIFFKKRDKNRIPCRQ